MIKCNKCGFELQVDAKDVDKIRQCPVCGSTDIDKQYGIEKNSTVSSDQLSSECEVKQAVDLLENKQYSQALEIFRKLAGNGDGEAMYYIGKCYSNAWGVDKDYNEALSWYKKSAQCNNSSGINALGYCYNFGQGVEKDYAKAVEWFTKSAELGNRDAMNNLGLRYYYGEGVEKDYAKAVEWFTKSAELGNRDAMFNLGLCYYNGKGIEQDYTKAVEWYTKSAELGNRNAMNSLGFCYDRGNGVEQDYTKAVEWYTKSANLGNRDAMNNLGNCYYYGNSVEKDYTKAVEWYTKSAELGDASAMCNLGNRYYYGEGVEQDYAKAVEWYTKSAELGNASAMFNLGNRYYYGEGVEKDYAKAVEWYTKSAELGNASAMFNLGNSYYKGEGVEKDYFKAVEWFTKSAELGNRDAMFNLAYCYNKGEGVEQNYTKAVEWYTKSAELGNAVAMDNLAGCYEDGQGVSVDKLKAMKLRSDATQQYSKDADNGDAWAMYRLAQRYENGKFVVKDSMKSQELFIKAVSRGCDEAETYLLDKFTQQSGFIKSFALEFCIVAMRKYVQCKQFTNEMYIKEYQLIGKMYNEMLAENRHSQLYDLLRKYEREGNCVAQFYFGILQAESFEHFIAGRKVWSWPDKEEQNRLIQLSAQQGYPPALYWAGYKEQAAESGFEYAEIELADQYVNDRVNLDKAVELYRSALSKGNTSVELKLARLYVTYFRQQHGAEAVRLLEKVYKESGNNHAASQLGEIYYEGQLVERNYNLAFKYLSSCKNPEPWSGVDYLLGCCYRYGYGTAVDKLKSAQHLRKCHSLMYSNRKLFYFNVDGMSNTNTVLTDKKSGNKLIVNFGLLKINDVDIPLFEIKSIDIVKKLFGKYAVVETFHPQRFEFYDSKIVEFLCRLKENNKENL